MLLHVRVMSPNYRCIIEIKMWNSIIDMNIYLFSKNKEISWSRPTCISYLKFELQSHSQNLCFFRPRIYCRYTVGLYKL